MADPRERNTPPEGYYDQPVVRRAPTMSVEEHIAALSAATGLSASAFTTEGLHFIYLRYPQGHALSGQMAARVIWQEGADRTGRTGIGHDLFVDPALRSRGISTLMLDTSIALAEEHGWTRIRHTTFRSRNADEWAKHRQSTQGEEVW